jgi:hypothetical protein
MFNIIANPTFKANVSLTVAGQDQLEVIEVEFRHKTRSALAEWLDRSLTEKSEVVLGEVIAGWKGLQDEQGIAAYSPEALKTLLENHLVAGRELVNAYIRGLTESRAKN